jgi:ribose transport system substrate-binding protein
MKRMIIAGLSAALAIAIATAATAADKKTLVFVVNGASDFWKIAEAGVKKAQGELPNYDLQFKYPEQARRRRPAARHGRPRRGGCLRHHGQRRRSQESDRGPEQDRRQALLFTTDSDAPKSKRVAYIGSSNTDLGKEAAS